MESLRARILKTRCRAWLLAASAAAWMLVSPAVAWACDCAVCQAAAAPEQSFSAKHDFFTNYGNYMPRIHCLQTAAGKPDWPWIIALIALQAIIITGYARIFLFWRRCYNDEEDCDRDSKLMELAWIFVLCAVCGYGLSTLIFIWPVYRLQALFLVGLCVITWRFAYDLEPFRKSFASHRLQRQLSESLLRENETLEEQRGALASANAALEQTTKNLRQSNSKLDEFAHAASHDLRSPLRAIDNLSQFVAEDLGEETPAAVQGHLTEMRTRVQRMERMLGGLLSYSRMQGDAFESEEFTVREAINESVGLLDLPSGFSLTLPKANLTIRSPRPPLEQVLRNLIDNAIRHHDRNDGEITIDATRQGNDIEFVIADDGPGIPEHSRDKVFRMFHTLRRQSDADSSGMGLAIVKRLIESHGGEIGIRSKGERGTAFYFTWPVDVVATAVDHSDSVPNGSTDLCPA